MGEQITKEQKYILYSIGQLYKEANQKLEGKDLQLAIDKVTFIEFAMKAKIAGKKERALYKNMEELEKRKLVNYANKELYLTKKGEKIFLKLESEILPYFKLTKLMKEQNPLKYTKKAQTIFRKK